MCDHHSVWEAPLPFSNPIVISHFLECRNIRSLILVKGSSLWTKNKLVWQSRLYLLLNEHRVNITEGQYFTNWHKLTFHSSSTSCFCLSVSLVLYVFIHVFPNSFGLMCDLVCSVVHGTHFPCPAWLIGLRDGFRERTSRVDVGAASSDVKRHLTDALVGWWIMCCIWGLVHAGRWSQSWMSKRIVLRDDNSVSVMQTFDIGRFWLTPSLRKRSTIRTLGSESCCSYNKLFPRACQKWMCLRGMPCGFLSLIHGFGYKSEAVMGVVYPSLG